MDSLHRCMAAGLSLIPGPEWTKAAWKHLFGACSTVTKKFASHYKRKLKQDTERKSSNEYKHARIEKCYHLAPSSTDRDYGPAAVTPNTTNQQELQKLCNEYLESLQVTSQQAAELTSIDRIPLRIVYGNN